MARMELGRVAVVALGRGALPARPDDDDPALCACALGVAELVTRGWHVVVTHTSGAYIEMARRRAAAAVSADPDIARGSLDVAAAEAQGALGYRLLMTLDETLARRQRHERAAVVLTRVLVSLDDPAFERAREDDACSRLATPKPLRLLDTDAISDLLDRGHVVVAAGGGGIPVARDSSGVYHGVEAAVDKDYTSARLAIDLDADLLVLCTDVARIEVDRGSPSRRELDSLDDVAAEQLLRTRQLDRATMAPKVEAALWFLRSPSRRERTVVVTTPDLVVDALVGRGGTTITTAGSRR